MHAEMNVIPQIYVIDNYVWAGFVSKMEICWVSEALDKYPVF